jgi:dihydropteroate synthase
MTAAARMGASMINDVFGFRAPGAIEALRDCHLRAIVMHSVSDRPIAQRLCLSADEVCRRIDRFFEERIRTLESAGIPRERLILDPGMGLFLSEDPAASIAVLRNIPKWRRFDLPIAIGISRKSFIGALLGTVESPRPIHERAAGTLAAELYAAMAGASYIRTHDVAALADALRVWQAIDSRGAIDTDRNRH